MEFAVFFDEIDEFAWIFAGLLEVQVDYGVFRSRVYESGGWSDN